MINASFDDKQTRIKTAIMDNIYVEEASVIFLIVPILFYIIFYTCYCWIKYF